MCRVTVRIGVGVGVKVRVGVRVRVRARNNLHILVILHSSPSDFLQRVRAVRDFVPVPGMSTFQDFKARYLFIWWRLSIWILTTFFSSSSPPYLMVHEMVLMNTRINACSGVENSMR